MARKLGDILCESRISGSDGLTARKITVKLYGCGVLAKDDTRIGSAATKYYRRLAGQLIYSKLDFLNGAIGIVPMELDGFESTLDLPCFDIDTEHVNPEWLLYYLSRPSFYLSFRGGAIGGRKAKRVQPAEFLARRIHLPPLPEQQRIAAILNAVDATIARTKDLICELRRTKKQVMGELFAQQKIRQANRFPLGKLARVGNGSTPRRNKAEYWQNGTIPWLTSAKIHEGLVIHADEHITPEAQKRCHLPLVPAGSVLVAITGQGKTRGTAAMLGIDACVSQHVAYITPNDSRVLASYVKVYLDTERDRLRRDSEGSGSTKAAITCRELKALSLPVPTLGEQRRLTATAESLIRRIEAEETTLAELEATKAGLMQELLGN